LASATTPLPANLVWLGNENNVWNTSITANFKNGGVASLFWDLDNATFDDTSSVKTVSLAANVSAGQVQINTSSGYAFTGSGGITAGTVTINGSGTVELANAGNSYSGNTVINGGTLSITGNANAMKSLMVVNNGATLLMNPTDAGSMTSNFTIASGGLLQIGTASSTGNIFPDNPSSIVNNGTIRVFDEEVLRAVSGMGKIEIEQETITLQANPSFSGTVHVKSGAVARVIDNSGLGSSSSITTVNSGGMLLIDASPTVAAALKVTGSGAGSGALLVAASNNASFSGALTLQGAQVTLRADAGATGTFSSLANGSVDQTDLVLHSELSGNLRLNGGLSLATGGVTKRGTGTGELRGAVNYTGDTSVEAGTLRFLGSGTITGAMNVSQGAALEIGGTHSLASTVRLSGGGQVIGDITMPGTIAPGNSAGMLTFTDDVTLTSSSVLEIEIGGTQAGVDFDFMQVVGAATLAGELQVSFIGSYMPQLGDEFQVLSAVGGLNGTTFGTTMLAPLEGGLNWNLSYGANFVKLAVQEATVVTLPGDYNGDGFVNAADYVMWRDTLGSMELLDADGDGNDIVDAGDYPVWSANFGASEGVGSSSNALSATAAVPEPASIALLLAAALGVIGLRTRGH
jgi:autotransporter-associated beta strand protein